MAIYLPFVYQSAIVLDTIEALIDIGFRKYQNFA